MNSFMVHCALKGFLYVYCGGCVGGGLGLIFFL